MRSNESAKFPHRQKIAGAGIFITYYHWHCSENVDAVHYVYAWFKGSDVEQAMQQIEDIEREIALLKKHLAAATKTVARAMADYLPGRNIRFSPGDLKKFHDSTTFSKTKRSGHKSVLDL